MNVLTNAFQFICQNCCCCIIKKEKIQKNETSQCLIEMQSVKSQDCITLQKANEEIVTKDKTNQLNKSQTLPKQQGNKIIEVPTLKIATSFEKQGGQSDQKQKEMRDSFKSVNSFGSKLSKRSFKVIKNLRSSRLSSKNSSKRVLNKKGSLSSNEYQPLTLNLQRKNTKALDQYVLDAPSQTQKFIDWLNSQYTKESSRVPLRIEESILMKLQNNVLLEMLTHKMQDYQTFYLGESHLKRANSMDAQQINKNIHWSFSKQNVAYLEESTKGDKYISFLQFDCNTRDFMRILKFLNKQEILSKYSNFNKVRIISSTQVKIQMPIIEVQQFSTNLLQKNTYQFVKQMEFVQFQDEDQHSLLTVDYNVNQRYTFEKLIQIKISEKGFVKVYIQSSELIKGDQRVYFKERWKCLESQLIKNSIISAN